MPVASTLHDRVVALDQLGLGALLDAHLARCLEGHRLHRPGRLSDRWPRRMPRRDRRGLLRAGRRRAGARPSSRAGPGTPAPSTPGRRRPARPRGRALRAARRRADRAHHARDPRAGAAGAARASARVVRPGRSVELLEASLSGPDGEVMRATAWRLRTGAVELDPEPPPDPPPPGPEEGPERPSSRSGRRPATTPPWSSASCAEASSSPGRPWSGCARACRWWRARSLAARAPADRGRRRERRERRRSTGAATCSSTPT